MMSLRFWMVPALALLAVVAAASTGAAKPPDLPQQLKITVEAAPGQAELFLQFHPIQMLPDVEFPCDEPAKVPNHCSPERQLRATVDASATQSVQAGLDRLIEAGEMLEKAKAHAKAGRVLKALKCVARACELAPGSTVARSCDEVIIEVTHKMAYGKAVKHCRGVEEAAEACCVHACPECCVVCAYMGRFSQMGMCWFAYLGENCEAMAKAKAKCHCEDACSKMGKEVMVDGLLKAAHLAMGAGYTCKARELVKQAHALDPKRVEADPLVYKMHLLPKKAAGTEEVSEPQPDHPKQHREHGMSFFDWMFHGE
jgi:hypothetical protein